MTRQVRCDTLDCEHRGVAREVPDQRVARGVVARPTLYCDGCGSQLFDRYARVEEAVTVPPERAVTRQPTRRKAR